MKTPNEYLFAITPAVSAVSLIDQDQCTLQTRYSANADPTQALAVKVLRLDEMGQPLTASCILVL